MADEPSLHLSLNMGHGRHPKCCKISEGGKASVGPLELHHAAWSCCADLESEEVSDDEKKTLVTDSLSIIESWYFSTSPFVRMIGRLLFV
jgi:hypothetical protein